MKKYILFVIGWMHLCPVFCQEERDYAAELAQLEAELDSLSIFALLDSVLATSFRIPSELIIRSGYSSNMVNAGRNYGIDQYGLSTSLSYYHRNGFYTDLTSYWNSDYDPMYTVSMWSGGYLNTFKNKISYSLSYERWLYSKQHESLATGFRNNLSGFVSYDFGPFYIGLDYSYLFNQTQSANRLIASIAGQYSLGKTWIFSDITFLPNANMVYGNDQITIYYEGTLIDAFRAKELLNSELERKALQDFVQEIELSKSERLILKQIRSNPNTSPEEKRRRALFVLLQNPEVANYLYEQLDQVRNQYGIMSYSLSLPVNLSIRNWRWMVAYTYSIPVSLPGENYEMDPIPYFSTSLSYRFRLSTGPR